MTAADLVAAIAALPDEAEIVIRDPRGGIRPEDPHLRPARLVRAFFKGVACGVSVHNPLEEEHLGRGCWRYEYFDGWAL